MKRNSSCRILFQRAVGWWKTVGRNSELALKLPAEREKGYNKYSIVGRDGYPPLQGLGMLVLMSACCSNMK